MPRIEDCKTCRFCVATLPPLDFECARYPRRVALPGWCGEWKPDRTKVCGMIPTGKTTIFGAPLQMAFLCLREKNHEGDHQTDRGGTFPRGEQPNAENTD